LQHDVVNIARAAYVENVHHVGMGQAGGRLRLLDEPLPELGITGKLRPQALDGHRPVQDDVQGPVDDGHAAVADFGLDPVSIGQQRVNHRFTSVPRARASKAAASTARPTGAACCPPLPPPSMMTATAAWGRKAGANPMNQAWASPWGFCAVPVLPATRTPSRAAARAVPSSTARTMASVTARAAAGEKAGGPKGSAGVARRTWPCGSRTSRTRWGFMATPP